MPNGKARKFNSLCFNVFVNDKLMKTYQHITTDLMKARELSAFWWDGEICRIDLPGDLAIRCFYCVVTIQSYPELLNVKNAVNSAKQYVKDIYDRDVDLIAVPVI